MEKQFPIYVLFNEKHGQNTAALLVMQLQVDKDI